MLSPLLRSLFVVLLLGLLTAGEPAATTATQAQLVG